MDVQPGDIFTRRGVLFAWSEIRTVTISIRGFATTLLEAPPGTFDDETVREFLGIIGDEAERMAGYLERMQTWLFRGPWEADAPHPADLAFELRWPAPPSPVLVLRAPHQGSQGLCIAAAIGTFEPAPPTSIVVPLPDLTEAQLPTPAWIDASGVVPVSPDHFRNRLGRLTPPQLAEVREGIRGALGLD